MKHWHDAERFDDSQVLQIKAMFAAVFQTDKPLTGWTLSDALMLRSDDDGVFYVANVFPEKVVWLKVAVHNPNFGVTRPRES